MIKLETIKRIAHDIISDVEWVNDSHSEAEHLGVQRGLNMLIRHLEEINQERKPNARDLMKQLQLQGWQSCAMWHVDNVRQNYECTQEQAMKVLENVLESERIQEEIYNAIDDEAERMEYQRTDNNPFI